MDNLKYNELISFFGICYLRNHGSGRFLQIRFKFFDLIGTLKFTFKKKVSSCGVVVEAENSLLKGCGFKPLCEDHFSGTIHLDQSLEQNLWKTLTWHFCIYCNPTNGMVNFEEWLAYKNPATWYRMNYKLVS
jgi:hypothetical protein